MANYVFTDGTAGLKSYMRTNSIDTNLLPRIASGLNIPIIHFQGSGQTAASFQRKIAEAEAQNLASLLGTTVANLKSNSVLTQL